MSKEPFVIRSAPSTHTMKHHLVRLVASGIQSGFEFSPHVFVRMKTGRQVDYNKPVSVKAASDRWVHFDTPDREVLFTRENVTFNGDRPFNDQAEHKWDYSLSLGFSTSCGDDFPIDRFMINPIAFNDDTSPRVRSKDTIVSSSKLIMSDSGGFQLGYGGLDFINPEHLVSFYSQNADEGVVLDIPSRALDLSGKKGRELLEATAKVHRMNGSYMYKNLPKGFRLGTVNHGTLLHDYDYYRKAVDDESVDYKFMCIPGTARFNIVEGCYRVLRVMLTGRQFEQYHLLGIASPPFIAMMAWMMAELARSGSRRLMTYDASSPIALTVNRGYYSQASHYSQFDRINYGEIDSGRKVPAGGLDNQFRMYAMQDPIMNLVGGYMDFIHIWPSHTVRAFLVYSNIHAMSRYTSMMNNYAHDLSTKEYKELLSDQFAGSKHKALLLVAVDFVSYTMQHGLDKAFEKFKFYLPTFTGSLSMKPFPLLDDGEEVKAVCGRTEELTKNVHNAIANFKSWHSGKWKNAPRFSKPNRVHKATNARALK